jgi:hypothetical protein
MTVRSGWISAMVLMAAALGLVGCSFLLMNSDYLSERDIKGKIQDTSFSATAYDLSFMDLLWGPPGVPVIPSPWLWLHWPRRRTLLVDVVVSNARTPVTLDLGDAALLTSQPFRRSAPIAIEPLCETQQWGKKIRIPPSKDGCSVLLTFALGRRPIKEFDINVGTIHANGERREIPKLHVRHHRYLEYNPLGLPID